MVWLHKMAQVVKYSGRIFRDDIDTAAPKYCNLLLRPCLLNDNAMLAELAAAKAAYATNKTFVTNSREITEALSPLKNWVTA